MDKGSGRLLIGTYVTPYGEIFRAQKLVKLEGSMAVRLPMTWCGIFANKDWVGLDINADATWVTRPLTEEELEVVLHEVD